MGERWRKHRDLYKGCLLSCAVLLLGGSLALGGFVLADAIVVLGGDGPGFPRVRQAIALFNADYAPTVVFSGGTLEDAGIACSSARLSLEAARKLGLPDGAAVIVEGAQSTYDEAVNIRRLARQRSWRSIIIVTDLFHTRRAVRTFRSLLPNTTIYVSAASDPRYDPGHWWQSEHSLVVVFSEVIKLAFYWAKYGIAPFSL